MKRCKFLALLLALVMALGLTACGGDTSSTDTPDTEDEGGSAEGEVIT